MKQASNGQIQHYIEGIAVNCAKQCVVCPRCGQQQEERALAFEGAGLLHASVRLCVSLQFQRCQGIIMSWNFPMAAPRKVILF